MTLYKQTFSVRNCQKWQSRTKMQVIKLSFNTILIEVLLDPVQTKRDGKIEWHKYVSRTLVYTRHKLSKNG